MKSEYLWGESRETLAQTVGPISRLPRNTSQWAKFRPPEKVNVFQPQGDFAPDHGLCLWTPLEALSQTPVIGSRKLRKLNKRRAVAAQTARSRCKFRYALGLFRDYRHTRASRLLESESVDSSIQLTLVEKVEID